MLRSKFRTCTAITLLLGFVYGSPAFANDATTELFRLLDKDGCVPESLIERTWTISTDPVGTHGELVNGDVLQFDLLGPAKGVNKKAAFSVLRNGVPWASVNGWTGQCVSDGELSLYVITGEINLEGCLHELAFGRMDHDDSLGDKIEVTFVDATLTEECTTFVIQHPGHAHGVD